MKKLFYFIPMLLVTYASFAIVPDTTSDQSMRRFCFREGEQYFSFGTGIYGLNNAISRKHDILLDFKNGGLPPVFCRYEKAISDYIGIGGTLFFSVPSYSWNKSIMEYNTETWEYSPVVYNEKYSGFSLGLLARMNYHFATTKTSDTYVGLGAGYEFFSMNYITDDPLAGERYPNRPLPFSAELVFGWRKYVSESTAIYAEVGYGKMLLNLGITIWPQN